MAKQLIYNRGEKLGSVTFLGDVVKPKQEKGRKRWGAFECPFCKNEFYARIDAIKRGNQGSCGCQKGYLKHRMYGTRLYRIWHDMITRCTYPSHRSYKNYGGRGIEVCDEWRMFIPFMEWASSNGYEKHLTIDRIDNNKSYYPNNCRWATRSQQELNKNKTGMEGVSFLYNKWIARVKRNGISKHIGMFNTLPEAIEARNKFIKNHYEQ